MRILAPRKRDSVTGEEAVLLSVTNAVVATTRQSNISTTTTSNNNNNVGQRTSGAPPRVDVLPEKLFNLVDCEGQHVYGSYTTAVVNYGNQNKKPVVVKKTSKLKHKESSSEEGNWRNRIGNKLADFWVVLNSYCCAAQEEAPPQESCRSEAEVEEDDEKSCPTKVNCGEAITIIVDEQQRQQESISKESEEECDAKSANVNTSEESLPKIVTSSSNCSSTVNTSSKTPCIVITRTPDITGESTHVKNTTKTASNVHPVAPNGTANFKTMRTGIYHEKQIKSLCALHALNNLLQDAKAFKQEDLDKICSELDPNSWVNPHKSVFGLGNYDINVIMTALQQKKLEAVWFDKRKDPSEELNFENIYGFILNIPSDCRLGWLALPIKRKHWVAIRNLPSVTERDNGRSNYYNLDSKFDKPESIGSTDNLIEYLRGELKSAEKELFLVVTEDIGRLETWRRNPPPAPSSSTTVGGAMTAASGSSTHLLPVPTGENGPDAAAGGGNNRRTSNDSGVVDLLPDLRDINVVDLNKEDLMRRQSSGVWSDLT